MRTCFSLNVCHKNVCVCMCVVWADGRGGGRARLRERARAEIRSLLRVLLEALMEVLLVFPFFAQHLLIDSLCACVCVCVCVCVSRTLLSWQVCPSPRGPLFSTKTLMWSDRTASGAPLWGDLHCGGDPRVCLVVDNNGRGGGGGDLKRTRPFSLWKVSWAVTSRSHSLFLSLRFSFPSSFFFSLLV